MKKFTVELRTEEGWGHFEGVRFATDYDAKNHANLCLADEGWIAARVWKAGPSSTGDRMCWDSRDKECVRVTWRN